MATAGLLDFSAIAGDANFGNRVFYYLVEFCTITIPSDLTSGRITDGVLHLARKNYAAQILNNPNYYKPLFVNAASANAIVAQDAVNVAGQSLVGLAYSAVAAFITSSVPTSSAVAGVPDVDVNNAVAAAFQAFISGIS